MVVGWASCPISRYSGRPSKTPMLSFAAMPVTAMAGVTAAVTRRPATTLMPTNAPSAGSAPLAGDFLADIQSRVGQKPDKPPERLRRTYEENHATLGIRDDSADH